MAKISAKLTPLFCLPRAISTLLVRFLDNSDPRKTRPLQTFILQFLPLSIALDSVQPTFSPRNRKFKESKIGVDIIIVVVNIIITNITIVIIFIIIIITIIVIIIIISLTGRMECKFLVLKGNSAFQSLTAMASFNGL